MVIFNKTENITKTNCKIAYKVYRSLKMVKKYFLTSKKMLTDVKGPIIIYAYRTSYFMSEMRNEHPVFQAQTSDQI